MQYILRIDGSKTDWEGYARRSKKTWSETSPSCARSARKLCKITILANKQIEDEKQMRDAWLRECRSRLKFGRPSSSSATIHVGEVDGNSLNQHPSWQDWLNSVNGVPGSRRYLRRGAHCVASSSPLNEISSFTGRTYARPGVPIGFMFALVGQPLCLMNLGDTVATAEKHYSPFCEGTPGPHSSNHGEWRRIGEDPLNCAV
jgi:hypothetical protein